MSDSYEFLTAENIAVYLASHKEISSVIDAESIVDIKEVGDGNLNFVFIIKDKQGKGIVLKQSLPYVRLVGPSWPMSPDRARIEYETTIIHSLAAKHLLPKIYFYDPERYIIAMEDLSDHKVWRTALNLGEQHFGAAEAIGEYIARVLFATSIFGAGAEAHYKGIARAINPELCLITEELVFTEPYFPAGRNSYLPENKVDAEAIISDEQMVQEIGQLKYKFMTSAEALLHGDLHTGSVMVKSDATGKAISTRAFDSEFSFYGPIGFDIGACFANFYIALAELRMRITFAHFQKNFGLPLRKTSARSGLAVLINVSLATKCLKIYWLNGRLMQLVLPQPRWFVVLSGLPRQVISKP